MIRLFRKSIMGGSNRDYHFAFRWLPLLVQGLPSCPGVVHELRHHALEATMPTDCFENNVCRSNAWELKLAKSVDCAEHFLEPEVRSNPWVSLGTTECIFKLRTIDHKTILPATLLPNCCWLDSRISVGTRLCKGPDACDKVELYCHTLYEC